MLPYEVIYCDKDILVVNKAPSLPCHSLESSTGISLIDAVAAEFPEVRAQFVEDREGGLCHRLDNGTSGLVLIARHPAAREFYRGLFANGEIEKSYLAIVSGEVKVAVDVRAPIAHHDKSKRKMVAVTSEKMRYRGNPQEAQTTGRVLLSNQAASLVRLKIGAGRRHQIRVHMALLGHPLVGDALYRGAPASFLRGHALHAAMLVLPSGHSLEAPCPQEWDDELKALGLTT